LRGAEHDDQQPTLAGESGWSCWLAAAAAVLASSAQCVPITAATPASSASTTTSREAILLGQRAVFGVNLL
jgi:hypothetical protein